MLSILFLLMLYGVVHIGYRIFNQRKCLVDYEIRNFIKDKLSTAEHDRVIGHLGICDKCRDKLHNHNMNNNIEDHLIE